MTEILLLPTIILLLSSTGSRVVASTVFSRGDISSVNVMGPDASGGNPAGLI